MEAMRKRAQDQARYLVKPFFHLFAWGWGPGQVRPIKKINAIVALANISVKPLSGSIGDCG